MHPRRILIDSKQQPQSLNWFLIVFGWFNVFFSSRSFGAKRIWCRCVWRHRGTFFIVSKLDIRIPKSFGWAVWTVYSLFTGHTNDVDSFYSAFGFHLISFRFTVNLPKLQFYKLKINLIDSHLETFLFVLTYVQCSFPFSWAHSYAKTPNKHRIETVTIQIRTSTQMILKQTHMDERVKRKREKYLGMEIAGVTHLLFYTVADSCYLRQLPFSNFIFIYFSSVAIVVASCQLIAFIVCLEKNKREKNHEYHLSEMSYHHECICIWIKNAYAFMPK